MAEPARPPSEPPPFDPRRVKRWIVGAVVVAAAVAAWFVVQAVNRGREDDRWAELGRIDRRHPSSTSSWLQEGDPSDLAAIAAHASDLEAFLAGLDADTPLAAHVHARLADLRTTSALRRMAAGGGSSDVDLAEAIRHLEVLRDRHPDAPPNWGVFGRDVWAALRPGERRGLDAPSATRLAIDRLTALREWERTRGPGPVEPDPDTVLLLRTTAGDLRLRLYRAASPEGAGALEARACAGRLDGVRVFERHDVDGKAAWARVGDERTRKADATDADREAWNRPSPGEPRAPEPARYRVRHVRGVVSAWTAGLDDPDGGDDDPAQLIVVLRDAPELDFAATPLARAEESSAATLDRIAALRTRREASFEEALRTPQLLSHFESPVEIVKALVYRKGALADCHDAAKVADDERSLATVQADRYRREPTPPPSPPAGPTAPPKDGTAPGGAAMDGTGATPAPGNGAGGSDAR